MKIEIHTKEAPYKRRCLGLHVNGEYAGSLEVTKEQEQALLGIMTLGADASQGYVTVVIHDT